MGQQTSRRSAYLLKGRYRKAAAAFGVEIGSKVAGDYVENLIKKIIGKAAKSFGTTLAKGLSKVVGWPAAVVASVVDAACASTPTRGGHAVNGTALGGPGGFYGAQPG
jgi:hypothetical protein